MRGPTAPIEIRTWRKRKRLTVRAAAALIVVDGKKATGATWHAWETGKKVPKPKWMNQLVLLTGVDPSGFYSRPDAGEPLVTPASDMQPALI